MPKTYKTQKIHNINITDMRVLPGDSAFLLDDGETSILYDTGFAFTGEELAQKVQKLLPDAITQYDASLAAEDFARYQKQVPGMFLWLGVGDTAALHNGKFAVPEDVLPIGVDTWLKIANHKW